MKKEIAGVVVLFYPDSEDLLHNLLTYQPFVDMLFVIDNTGPDASTGLADTLKNFQHTGYIGNTNNEGIAAALNKAAGLAAEKGYSWLLTMDQDSFFEENQAVTYFSAFENEFATKEDIGLVSPSHAVDLNLADKSAFTERISVMTSGNLLRLSAWKELNGFDEKLFIDEVDHEFCYRLKKKGYRIVQLNHVFLNHQLGSQKEAGYLGGIARRKRRIHAPVRVYFMVRNYLYVRRQYRKLFPDEFRERDKALLVTLKNNLLFSGNFRINLRMIRKAWQDFKKGNFPESI